VQLRGLLYDSGGGPRLVVPGVLAVIIAFVLTLVATSLVGRAQTEVERAEALYRSGKPAQAEAIYARLVREKPTVPVVLALLQAHEHAKLSDKVTKTINALKKGGGMTLPEDVPPLSDEEIDKIVTGLPPDVGLIARYWQAIARRDLTPELSKEVEEGAKREPPVPWTNHLLAQSALRAEKLDEAAELFEREGLAFPERSEDIDQAISILVATKAWERVDAKMQNPRIAAAVGPSTRYDIAIHNRQWGRAIVALPSVLRGHYTANGLIVAGVAAFGWLFFCARLGKVGARPLFRIPMYLAAFALGVLSIGPTVLVLSIEEEVLRLVKTGDIFRDLLFCIFGIGLREEGCKLLLFLPLLPILRKWGDKLDVLVCAALVGLGFAAEENLGYLARGSLTEGLARFLTANFFHMSLTGIVGSALDDFITDRERNAQAFTKATLLVVGLHGLYDFLIFHGELGGAYFAMGVFVVLTRMFLEAVDVARRRADRGITPLHAFIMAVGLVTGVTFAHAYASVGWRIGLLLVGSGLLGMAIIVYIFVRTLRTI
jgi:protease PrsW